MKKYIFFLLISVASNFEINTQSNLTDIYQKILNLKELMKYGFNKKFFKRHIKK